MEREKAREEGGRVLYWFIFFFGAPMSGHILHMGESFLYVAYGVPEAMIGEGMEVGGGDGGSDPL